MAQMNKLEELNSNNRKDLSSLIDTYKEAINNYQSRSGGSFGRTKASHIMRSLAPIVEQELRNQGGSETTKLSGRYGLERQKLADIGAIEQIGAKQEGAMTLQEMSDKAAMNRLGESKRLDRLTQADQIIMGMERDRRERQANLRRPVFQRATDVTGLPIEYTNINTPEQRMRSTSAGVIDKSDEDFFFGRAPTNEAVNIDIPVQPVNAIPNNRRSLMNLR